MWKIHRNTAFTEFRQPHNLPFVQGLGAARTAPVSAVGEGGIMARTIIAVFVAAILAAGVTPVVPASPARADPNPAIAQCRALLPFRPASNLGECLSYITVANNES